MNRVDLVVAAPKIIVFDSGFGGLTVYGELKKSLPDADYLYVADNAAFPYGALREDELVTRLLALFDQLIDREKPDVCVIACNTASTIALAPLRDHFEVPFVGTVPAIKMAAEKTSSGLFSVLATPGTVKRDYTRDLIDQYAASHEVTLVGARNLANMAEDFMRGKKISNTELLSEITPAFVDRNGRRTDIIVLGCTHFPLLTQKMRDIAPWEVRYIDPAPAIARQTESILSRRSNGHETGEGPTPNRLLYTDDQLISDNLADFLRKLGLEDVYRDEIIG